MVCQAEPLYTHNFASVVSNTINPAAGLAIAFFCVVVMLGIRTPLVVLCASRIADALAVVPIPRLPEESIRALSIEVETPVLLPKTKVPESSVEVEGDAMYAMFILLLAFLAQNSRLV